MKKMYLLPIVLMGVLSYGQMGVNNLTPKSTVDIASKTTDGSTSEGLLIPRLTGNQLKAAETAAVYASAQHATLVFVTAAPDSNNRTGQVEGMDAPGFYYFDAGSNRWIKILSSGASTPALTQLLCSAATHIGVLEATSPASGVSVTVPYNGGNGGVYSEQIVPSVGVTGINAVLASGTLNNGSGNLIFNIVGTPAAAGTATFNINLGGESCGFNIMVQPNTNFADVVPVIINGETRQMMTRNLGADPTMDPDIPTQAIMGSYYQWGKKNAAATAYTSEAAISGWNTTNAANKAWNSGTEAAPVKTANDPCPAGFRVPTGNELSGFNAASTVSNIGTFVASPGSATNFSVAKKFVNNGSTLTFPVAGQRNYSAGVLEERANRGVYWSSSESQDSTVYSIYFTLFSTNVSGSNFGFRTMGYSIRCISE
ncbi:MULTISPECIES: FISUMP domain-containing protein [unclassified Chryseobacterium]|jgi:uncharacterized protein (TIGR02145 family)|nr:MULTISPECIES: FISUMP domain-containing protein [unclassified Chryseobacterium]MBP1164572.1 uncharacterized protein (TIGR02145 family) [Chryseobacterium sp. PvR013]